MHSATESNNRSHHLFMGRTVICVSHGLNSFFSANLFMSVRIILRNYTRGVESRRFEIHWDAIKTDGRVS